MPQFIVTVKRLNKRRVVPVTFPDRDNIIGEVKDGFSFEGIEADSTEVPNAALGKWYKDRDRHFYWGGGVRDIAVSLISPPTLQTKFPFWIKNDLYSIPDLWDDEAGPKVSVAILDTGINEHVDFDFSKIKGFNYLDNSTNYKTDAVGHGTHLAGIIAAKGIKSFGILPVANLFVAKVCDNSGTPVLGAVKNALTDILNNTNEAIDIDVVNMSFNLIAGNDPSEKKILDEITDLLKKISVNKKCILVSACGDEDWVFENFPALLEECISVGSIDSTFKRSSFSTKSTTLDIMAMGENIISSMGTDSSIPKSGTSQSAAIISAICALGIREFKKKGSFNSNTLKRILFQTAINNSFMLNEHGHGIFNPNIFFKTIQSV